ncbi:MAG: NAD(P)H-binding protein [Robiginitomaculum sp.]|nr:NAD(P)H-binding protein [Robiginitomaculum sp.]
MKSKPKSQLPLIALTGATGFVGGRVLQMLLDQNYCVKALVRSKSNSNLLQSKNLNWVEGSLEDTSSLAALTLGADMVIHMAGLVTARTKDDYFRINSTAVGDLARIANEQNVKRFVYLSSITARKPKLSDYAASKRGGEGRFSRKLGKMKGVCVRAPAVIGAGDKATAPFYAFILKGYLPCPGGKNWRDRKIGIAYVDDLARFLIGPCLQGEHDGKTVSVATRASLTWPEFASECAKAVGKPVRPIPLPVSLLYMVASGTSVTKRVLGKGHLTLGKLQEFLYEDWSVSAKYQTDTSLQSILKATLLEDLS